MPTFATPGPITATVEVAGAQVRVTASDRTDTVVLVEPINKASRKDVKVADKTKMNFGSGGNTKSKAWRDIWGSGQGIGQITDAPPVAELVARLKAEFDDAGDDFLRRARA